MKIMIHRGGKDYGPYSVAEVRDLLLKAIFVPDDLAWVEGAENWVPLQDLLSGDVKPVPKTTLPAPSAGGAAPEQPRPFPIKALAIGGILLVILGLGIWMLAAREWAALSPLTPLLETKSNTPSDHSDFPDANRFFTMSADVSGDTITGTMVTDASHEHQLCDEVMGHIYSLAMKNPSSHHLKLVLQVIGKKETEIDLDNLDDVRSYSGKRAYELSPARPEIGNVLISAGLIQNLSPGPESDF